MKKAFDSAIFYVKMVVCKKTKRKGLKRGEKGCGKKREPEIPHFKQVFNCEELV